MNIDLRPLREDEFAEWGEVGRSQYAADMVANAGMTPERAHDKAERDFSSVLPQGLATPGHWIFVAEVDGRRVGRLWFAERVMDGLAQAFLYDIWIDEAERGRGYGRAAMLAFEHEAARRGLNHVALNVFGGNERARKLYRSMGYAEQAVQMTKTL
jgi:ribosomal protein S18 acetylase RimI-like enzyme